MNKIIAAIGLLIGICCGFRAAHIHAQTKGDRMQIEKLNSETARMKDSLRHMKDLPDLPLITLEQNARQFYETVDMMAHYRGVKKAVHMEGINEQGMITQAFKLSAWPGIMTADVKIILTGIAGVDQNMAVLDFMRQMEADHPVRVKEIAYQGKGLALTVELYGT